MKSGLCAAIVFGAAAGLLAQQPAASDQAAPSSAGKTITISGCVQRAEPSATGTSGTAGATADASKFILTNTAKGASPTAGTAGASSEAVAASYRLDADDAKLTPHVGHKVEIAGTVEPSMPSASSPASSMMSTPKLKVDSVKMIASSCP
jgi:hypothetical protein